MTITFKTGNILDAEENLILQQVNYQGIMNGGLAKQIRNKWPEIYDGYCKFIDKYSWEQIKKNGLVNDFEIKSPPNPQYIINIFGQEYYGRDKCYTDYAALRNSLVNIFNVPSLKGQLQYSIAIPWKISCGLAGGDWDNIVWPMIQEIFENSEVKVVIYRLEDVDKFGFKI